MPNLFPVFEIPSAIAEKQPETQKYKPSPLFDFEKGDFVLDGANRVVYGSGYDAWVIWCTKTIMTQRWAHLAYGKNAGIEAEEAFEQQDRSAVEASFKRTVTEALLADPKGRTRQVMDFTFSWKGDELYIGCTVIGVDGNSASIRVKTKNSG